MRSYFSEFGTSMWERFKADLSYRLLRTDYKIKAEVNGRVVVGAFRYAELIALEVFYSQLRLQNEDDKIGVLEGMHFLEKNKPVSVPDNLDKKSRLEILEVLCKPYVFSKIKKGRVSLP